MNKIRCLIAGGAGFIGSHLAESLLHRGFAVTVVDNLITGSLENISHLQDNNNFEFIQLDITKEPVQEENYRMIFHLASIANPTEYEQAPYETLSVNSLGSQNLLELAKKSDARYCYFSSSEVYGSGDGESITENRLCKIVIGQIRSPYTIGKMYGEEITRAFCKLNSIEYIIIRPFNIYGSRMDCNTTYGRVIPNFIRWAMANEPLRVNGDGLQERSFCHIDDFIGCTTAIINTGTWINHVVNVGCPDSIPIIELAKLINQLSGNSAGIEFRERYEFEPFYRKPDINRVHKWVGWRPKIELTTGLARLIQEGV